MDLPRFSVGRELAELIASSGILHKAWEEIDSVSKRNDSFLLNKYEGVIYVSFPSWDMEDILVKDGKYGECNIQSQNRVFSARLSGVDGKPAFVHKGALLRFLDILENSDFKEKMHRLRKQTVIFAGHSIGGAVATLATLWFLGDTNKRSSPFCVTFGSPLVGDGAFREAIERENWSRNFLHVVSKYDIVPRMLLAPLKFIADPLDAIIPVWESKMGVDEDDVRDLSIPDACNTLLRNVTRCTSPIANNYLGGSSLQSPYRPLGTYMFCSKQGAACIEDSAAVVKILHLTMESCEGISREQIADACISDHTDYDLMLKDITQILLNSPEMADFLQADSFEIGTALELEAMGIGSQNIHARFALISAGRLKIDEDIKFERLDLGLSKMQSQMSLLEWYKGRCKRKCGYYDSFKSKSEKVDFHAQSAILKLRAFWDEIVDLKSTKRRLVEPLEIAEHYGWTRLVRNKWINAGTTYRRLVEPLEIAEHYGWTNKHNKSYLSEGIRPHRHIVLEKWLREKEQTRIGRDQEDRRTRFASLTEDSCFWARVEDALMALENDRLQTMNTRGKESREFENYVWSMIEKRSISMEVFLKGSRFTIWWEKYLSLHLQSTEWRSTSDLFDFMMNKRWK